MTDDLMRKVLDFCRDKPDTEPCYLSDRTQISIWKQGYLRCQNELLETLSNYNQESEVK